MMKDSLRVFKDTARKYLSSLSARSCPYVYMNMPGMKNRLIVTNATPDMFIIRSSQSQIALHVVHPYEGWIDHFARLFQMDEHTVYIFQAPLCMKLLQSLDTLKASLPISLDPSGNITTEVAVSASPEPKEEAETSEEIDFKDEVDRVLDTTTKEETISRDAILMQQAVGIKLTDPHVLSTLEALILNMEDDYTYCTTNKIGVIQLDLTRLHADGIKARYYLNWYLTPYFSGTSLHLSTPFVYKEQQLVLIDGRDIPCVGELLIKGPSTNLTFYIYTKDEGGSVKKLSHYKDETGDVYTTRPMDQVYLLKQKP